ncbi:hypothetical protein DVH24_042149 [Malus domestica]|uniref:Enoyl reductase (ER) domain-containing protein n=1 Tax=Malus domestica TaxID=3750 RepID=A0A498IXM0_MALDO|nr:hypothetical protein DVH24_042149 [Malus domestica]
MELKPGLSALVTGGASGIGKALSLALATKAIFVTVVDFSEEKGKEVASLVQKVNAKFHSNFGFPSAVFVKCDVSNTGDITAAFEKHLATFGGLDICINSAGIVTSIPFNKDQTNGTHTWRKTINVNLMAVIDCTRLAIKTMEALKMPGVIINMVSSAGLYPLYTDPIYSGSKDLLFHTNVEGFASMCFVLNKTLLPTFLMQFVETKIGSKVGSKFISLMDGYVSMETVVKGAFELITDESKAGSCLWITNRRGMEYWPTPAEEEKYLVRHSSLRKRVAVKAPFSFQLPQSFENCEVVHTLSHNFRKATSIVRAPLRLPIEPHNVLVKIIYAGVNASDQINICSNKDLLFIAHDVISVAKPKILRPVFHLIAVLRCPKIHSHCYLSRLVDKSVSLLQAVEINAAAGESVTNLQVGTPAAVMSFGSYAEFAMVPSKHILPVERPDPEVVAMLTSGLTASIALEKAGQMKSGKIVLVTVAAGGTGQFAAQLAGNTVVATCGGAEKAKHLKELGVDRVIDYKAEDIKTVEFPKGVDIIYESVGGDMFDLCLNALVVYGRLVVIGMTSQVLYSCKHKRYDPREHGWKPSNYPGICKKILAKCQTVAGFFLMHYSSILQGKAEGKCNYICSYMHVSLDPKQFLGVRQAADAVEYLHSGKSVGKGKGGAKNFFIIFWGCAIHTPVFTFHTPLVNLCPLIFFNSSYQTSKN